jgi:two-component system response regulator PilR (NtrC family)
MESELFGHARGAFTGATVEKRGLFEMAESGTIFLDEIGEMDLGLQAKLLRAIDRKEIVRVGGVTPIRLEARIVCASNRDLREQIDRKLFREDLYYRISIVELRIPPLRERPEDIPELAAHFIRRFNRDLRRECRGVDPAAMAALQAHEWRGNVRELQNVIERAMILRDARTITLEDLPASLARAAARPARRLRDALRAFERDHIRAILEDSGRNRETAARRLGIGVSTLYRKMKRLDLEAGERIR